MIHTTTPWARDAMTSDLRASLEAMFPDGLRVAAVGRWWVLTTLVDGDIRQEARRIKVSRNVSLLDACEWLSRRPRA